LQEEQRLQQPKSTNDYSLAEHYAPYFGICVYLMTCKTVVLLYLHSKATKYSNMGNAPMCFEQGLYNSDNTIETVIDNSNTGIHQHSSEHRSYSIGKSVAYHYLTTTQIFYRISNDMAIM